MLSSIHPLGERSRHNSWAVTATSFAVGSVLAGTVIGIALGFVGSRLLGAIDESLVLVVTATVVLIAGLLDSARVDPPGPERQVNEHWIGRFRGWVYGGAFGLELGSGFVTFIVTWGVYATFASELLTASPAMGGLVGATFGFGRSLLLLVARYVDRPSRLTAFNRRLADAGPVVSRSAAAVMALGGITMILAGAL